MKMTLLILISILTGQPAQAVGDCSFTPPPSNGGRIGTQRVASGLNQPVGIAFARTQLDRMYVIEKPGRVLAVKWGGQTGVVLDIRSRVGILNPEEGLLGIAIHPRFPEDPRFFVNYTTKRRTTRISSFTIGSNGAAAPNSERVILEFRQPYRNHNGGDLKFGPDGMLYIATGDGGDGGDPDNYSQNLRSLLGKMLRIDVSPNLSPYGVPRDNPFVSRPNARKEIWAYGLRNPWRFSFDRQNGTLWTGDVGQERLEEINVVRKGGNYGWRIKEGTQCYNPRNCSSEGLIDPIWQYSRENGKSVTGGFVYRGQAINGLQGAYLYTDFYNGKIWGLRVNRSTRQVQNTLLLESGLFIASFGEDQYGELYVVDLQRGEVHKIVSRGIFGRGAAQDVLPRKLSDTGCFKSMNPPRANDHLVPFTVNSPLWTDYATKERFISLPKGQKAKFSLNNVWQLPEGTTLVKNFYFDFPVNGQTQRKIIETRLLVKSKRGFQGFTYAWNSKGTDAILLEQGTNRRLQISTPEGPKTINYLFPSRAQCTECHAPGGFGPLAFNVAQTNRILRGANGQTINQIHYLTNRGVFDRKDVPGDLSQAPRIASPNDPNAGLNLRTRAWLHSNCAHCHNRVGGTGRGTFDLRWGLSLASTNLCNSTPLTGNTGIPGATILKAGDTSKSLLYLRTITMNPKFRMPQIATALNDPVGSRLLEQWVEQVTCPTPGR